MNNDLTKYTGGDATPLQVRANRKTFPRIKDTSPEDSLKRMKKIVISSYIYVGRGVDDNQIEIISKALLAELLKDDFCRGTRNLAWIDIDMAIRRGVLGLGKEMFGISVSTLYQAIINYLDDVVRPAQIRLKQLQNNKSSAVTDTVITAYAKMMAEAKNQNKHESEL